jgi:predicted kinase
MNKSRPPLLIIMGGLPGTGKTALSKGLAQQLPGVYLRIDVIEQSLRNFNGHDVTGEGYAVARALAESNLLIGHTVIADAVNPIPLTREAWRTVGLKNSVKTVEIEVICSDKAEHKRRVEERTADIPGHEVPIWQKVLDREYHPWDTKDITIDTAGKTTEEALALLMEQIK